MLYGVDVSHWQGDVDFKAMAQSEMEGRPPFRFAIVKATEGANLDGKGYRDPKFVANWGKLLELDPAGAEPGSPWLVRGAYHFARQDNRTDMLPEDAGKAEADWFCTNLEQVGHYGPGCLPPFLDFEKWSGRGERNRRWIGAFLETVEQRLGRSAAIYTGPNVWRAHTDNWGGLIGRVPLWEVKYTPNGWDPQRAYPNPRLLKDVEPPWEWTFWQWSAGKSGDSDWRYYLQKYGENPPGVGGSADVNRFDGTEEDLLALALIGDRTP